MRDLIGQLASAEQAGDPLEEKEQSEYRRDGDYLPIACAVVRRNNAVWGRSRRMIA
jgi:hypothetical protein